MNVYIADTLFVVTALIYTAASVLFLAYLMGSGKPLGKLPARLIGLGAVFHGSHIILASFVLHICPVAGIHFPMSIVSMFMCIGYFAMRTRYRIDVVGAFVAPLALSSLLASHFVVNHAPRLKSALSCRCTSR